MLRPKFTEIAQNHCKRGILHPFVGKLWQMIKKLYQNLLSKLICKNSANPVGATFTGQMGQTI